MIKRLDDSLSQLKLFLESIRALAYAEKIYGKNILKSASNVQSITNKGDKERSHHSDSLSVALNALSLALLAKGESPLGDNLNNLSDQLQSFINLSNQVNKRKKEI